MTLSCMTLGLTACGEKKPEPPKESAVASPVALPTTTSETVPDANQMVRIAMKEDLDENMKFVAETNDVEYYVSSKTRQRGEYKFSYFSMFYKNNSKSGNNLKGDDVLYGADFDCQNKRMRGIFRVLKRDGKVTIESEDNPEWWKNFSPESPGGEVISTVCSR